MNKKMIVYATSRIMVVLSTLMLLPIFVGLFYKEDFGTILSFVKAMIIVFIIFVPFTLRAPEDKSIFIKEGFIITTLTWLLMSFFGCLPFYFSGEIPSLVDSFFEMVSGLTTTGASIISDLTPFSHSILFWRSFSHFIGGMGVLVLALAILPEISASSVHVMKAEVPGPQFGKLLPKIKSSARILYFIYIILTLVLIIALIIAGMPVFDSVLHAFGTAGTGGFGVHNGSIGYYNSPIIEFILSIGMITFGINFNIFYMILIRRSKDALASEELKIYLRIIGFATIFIFLNVMFTYENLFRGLIDSFFTVASIITTTGFSTVDYSKWPTFSKWIIIMLMFFGGSAGSTAGGLKISRVIIGVKTAIKEIRQTLTPNRKVSITYDSKPLDIRTEKSTTNYIIVYFVLFASFMFLLGLSAPDFESTFSAIVTTFNNVGPGLGIIGPSGSYASFSNYSKILLSIIMMTGRLEIFPILIFFAPSTWRNH